MKCPYSAVILLLSLSASSAHAQQTAANSLPSSPGFSSSVPQTSSSTDYDRTQTPQAPSYTIPTAVYTRRPGSIGVALEGATTDLPNLTPILRSLQHGLLGQLDLDRPVRFRVELPGPQRGMVISAIRNRTGWVNDPTDWQLNVTRRGPRWVAEVGKLHYSRRFSQLRRQPWSTNPVLAGILVRLAKIKPDQIVHDPCCGTATLLITAQRAVASLRLSGTDHDQETAELAWANLHDHRVPAAVVATDAIPIPHRAGTVDRIISNLPFGKRVGSHADNTHLYHALLPEIARTLCPDGRAILLTEDKRLLVDAVSSTPGIKIVRQRLLRYNGATPTAYTITRTRTSRRK